VKRSGTNVWGFLTVDAKSGGVNWGGASFNPALGYLSTYKAADSRQYVVIAAAGGTFRSDPVTDDTITAFTLSK
jgi:glucose dehydrogenase